MKQEKDFLSYIRHDKDYEGKKDFYTKENIIAITEKDNRFTKNGYELALSITKNMPNIFVDIGCGMGWLMRKMSPYFNTSIGIEMSHAAILAAQKITSESRNVSFIEKDMIDGYKALDLKEPAFFTTGIVFSHLKNYYIEEFLVLLNTAPKGSALYFGENYDRNMHWRIWHLRNQEWWVKNLSNWQIIFLNIEDNRYSFGIYGICVGKEHVLKNHERGLIWKIGWNIDRVSAILYRAIKKILRLFKIIK